MARRTWRKCLHSKSITGKAGRICIAWRESDDGGGYGQETLPNARSLDERKVARWWRSPDRLLRTACGQETLPNARSLDGGGLPTDYYGQPAVRRPCPTQGRSMVEVSRPTTTGRAAVRRPCPTQGRSMVEVSRPTTTGRAAVRRGLRSGDLAQHGSGDLAQHGSGDLAQHDSQSLIAESYSSDTNRRTRIISSRRSRTIPGFSRPAAFSNQARACCLSPSLRWHNPT